MTEPTVAAAESRPNLDALSALERRNHYVTRYYDCVEKVAKRLVRRLPRSTELADLMSAGALGLIEAATRYDPSRGDSFEAFAQLRIKGAMLDDIPVRDSMSRDMRRSWKAFGGAASRLTQQLGRKPTEEELADEVGVSLENLRRRRNQLAGAQVIGLEDAGVDVLERTADLNAADPQELASRRELVDRLSQNIAALPKRMQQVLSLYYRESLSLKEIGAVLGVTECRVCQIHREAARRLRVAQGDADTGREAA
jgi:RNA polymerase sigma factor for flagellar operon FliA